MKSIGLNFLGIEFAIREAEQPVPRIRFECGCSNWEEAIKKSTGYDESSILSKAIAAAIEVRDGRAKFERDTVVFYNQEYDYPLLTWLLYAILHAGCVRVLDFGGALGSLYYQHRSLLEQYPGFAWGVVEQEHFVKAGQKEFETEWLHFYNGIKCCFETMRPNFLLISGVLQYLREPYALLAKVLDLRLPFVLIHRTMAQRQLPEQVAIQRVPSTIYDASYPTWILDANRLESEFDLHGYDVLDNFDPHPGAFWGPDNMQMPYQGWFLVRRGTN
jgi:putative methyltransferase (TIGR04325 family)